MKTGTELKMWRKAPISKNFRKPEELLFKTTSKIEENLAPWMHKYKETTDG